MRAKAIHHTIQAQRIALLASIRPVMAKRKRKQAAWPSWEADKPAIAPEVSFSATESAQVCSMGRAISSRSWPSLCLSLSRTLSLLQARASLLQWYDAQHRVLPWRLNRQSKHETDNPIAQLSQQEMLYRVWVSWNSCAASTT